MTTTLIKLYKQFLNASLYSSDDSVIERNISRSFYIDNIETLPRAPTQSNK